MPPQSTDDGKSSLEAQFSSFYLQRTTAELSADLDHVRNADDFKGDSISFLVHALRQGTCQFSIEDKKRVVSDLSKAESRDAGA
ncbi:hypothetical protein DCS_03681 [Drechmeria coniospora]|uniref:Ribosome assembly protein 3 n=1 Tax=Drechmeria coniospora TaxID=98403 RepID=A0A151GHY2_DRECN|nr:hypothetical protein DCS_03681 [Drechmeria coniospora]KYK56679.1 hypothetical protein DCS_03681 [Drechmeria coniospora]ODA77118.1 hypothetical protein RJ55_07636 [Drechmeria coniospora]